MALGERIDPRGRVRAADFLAEAHLANGRLRDAERALADAGAVRSRVDELPFEDRFYHDLLVAQLDTAQGRYDEALAQIDRATTAVTVRLGVGGAAWMDLQLRAVDALRKAGRVALAAQRLRSLRTALAERPALESQFGAAIVNQEIVLRLDSGQPAAAAALMAERSAVEQHRAGSASADEAMVQMWHLGRLDLAMSRPRDAQQRFEHVIDLLDAQGHPGNPELAHARLLLAEAWAAQRRFAAAGSLRRQALAALDGQGAGPHYRRVRPAEPSTP
jgi:tetratricopeptide (TPR) repeat protein